MKDLLITLLNTAFLGRTAFQYGWRGVRSAEGRANAMVQPKPAFFTVSDWEMRVFRKIGLPKWKDRLPQFNPRFDKAAPQIRAGYGIPRPFFCSSTCRAEVIHYVISVLGWVSLVFVC